MNSDGRQTQVDAIAERRQEARAEGELPPSNSLERCSPGHDSNNVSTQQEATQKRRRTFGGIEYDHIIAIDKNDRIIYNSADYATEQEGGSALRAWFIAIVTDAMKMESHH